MTNLAAVQTNGEATFINVELWKSQLNKLVGDVNANAEHIQNAIMLALREYIEGGRKNPTYLTHVIQATELMRGYSASRMQGYILAVCPTLVWDKDKKRLQNREKGVAPRIDQSELYAIGGGIVTWDKWKAPAKEFDLDKWAKSAATRIDGKVELNEALDALKLAYAKRHIKTETAK